jgi:hypothetical protein
MTNKIIWALIASQFLTILLVISVGRDLNKLWLIVHRILERERLNELALILNAKNRAFLAHIDERETDNGKAITRDTGTG